MKKILLRKLRDLPRRVRSAKADRRGIGLLEAMVALLVLMIGIVSVMVLMVSNTFMARVSRDQLIASNLAREGVEIVRSVRDSNWLKIEAIETYVDGTLYKWDDGLFDPDGFLYGAYPTFNEATQTWSLVYTADAAGADVWKVYWKQNTVTLLFSLYNQYSLVPDPADAVVTKYTRKIYTYPICYDNVAGAEDPPLAADGVGCAVGKVKIGVQVKVEVKWLDNGNARTSAVEARLYNWK